MPIKKSFGNFKGYEQLLMEIRSILDKGRFKAYQAVDNIRVQTYWQIGERIVREELKHKDRADYGRKIVEQLAKDLGFSRTILFEIMQVYKIYPIVRALPGQLSWTHIVMLIHIEKAEERKFYEIQAIRNGWSYRELRFRIRQKEYEKARKKENIDFIIPKALIAPEEIFKTKYNWDFLKLEENHTERQLEIALVENIRKVIKFIKKGLGFNG